VSYRPLANSSQTYHQHSHRQQAQTRFIQLGRP
jgi:hypothetical protein